MSAQQILVAVGQFPPPVTGFAHITACVVEALRAQCGVVAVNIGATTGRKGIAKHFERVMLTLRACAVLLSRRLRGDSRTCYVACEGALGLVYTIMMVAAARALGYRIMLHHHSFNYVDRPNALMRALLVIGGDLVHVFLCSDMRDRFEQAYGRIVRSTIVSNAAFVTPAPARPRSRDDDRLALGHLSNLTREKGLHLFLDLVRGQVAAGRAVRGVLAGPVALEEDRRLIEAACGELGSALSYRGPLYGAQKDAFYEEIDVFVFGTSYVNEAQPTVLFEALAAGCKVLSFDRGCIARQVEEDGLVLPQSADFLVGCMGWLDGNEDRIQPERPATRARYIARHQAARETVSRLIDDDMFSA